MEEAARWHRMVEHAAPRQPSAHWRMLLKLEREGQQRAMAREILGK